MPSLNLRLSREEHEELVRRAAANGRSVQREIVWSLFRGRDGLGAVEGTAAVRPDQVQDLAVPDTSAATGLGDDVPVAGRRSREASVSCVKMRMHHIYHSGKPCPECGYPREGAVS